MKPSFTPPSTRKIEITTLILSIASATFILSCWLIYLIDDTFSIAASITFLLAVLLSLISLFFAIKEILRGNYTPLKISIVISVATIFLALLYTVTGIIVGNFHIHPFFSLI